MRQEGADCRGEGAWFPGGQGEGEQVRDLPLPAVRLGRPAEVQGQEDAGGPSERYLSIARLGRCGDIPEL